MQSSLPLCRSKKSLLPAQQTPEGYHPPHQELFCIAPFVTAKQILSLPPAPGCVLPPLILRMQLVHE